MTDRAIFAPEPEPLARSEASPADRLSPALVVVCRVTTACNLACAFCAYDRHQVLQRSSLGHDRITRLIALMADTAAIAARRAPLLSWLGGEPLRWRDWVTFSARAQARGLRVSATTNATTLGLASTRAAVLAHLDELTVSVDAVGERHDDLRGWPGGYAQTRSALRELADERAQRGAKLRLRANVVLMRSTIDDFASLSHQLAESGVDEISFNLLGGRDRPEFHARESVSSAAVAHFAQQLPPLRAALAPLGVQLIGSAAYLQRLYAVSCDQAWPVADCAPGRDFLFVDEHGRVAPCAYTGAEYGIALEDITQLAALPQYFRDARRRRCAAACADCPSTQVFGKFNLGAAAS